MKKSRYSENKIVKKLKEVEAGKLVKDVCREYGTSDATYYNWKFIIITYIFTAITQIITGNHPAHAMGNNINFTLRYHTTQKY